MHFISNKNVCVFAPKSITRAWIWVVFDHSNPETKKHDQHQDHIVVYGREKASFVTSLRNCMLCNIIPFQNCSRQRPGLSGELSIWLQTWCCHKSSKLLFFAPKNKYSNVFEGIKWWRNHFQDIAPELW